MSLKISIEGFLWSLIILTLLFSGIGILSLFLMCHTYINYFCKNKNKWATNIPFNILIFIPISKDFFITSFSVKFIDIHIGTRWTFPEKRIIVAIKIYQRIRWVFKFYLASIIMHYYILLIIAYKLIVG